MKIGIIGTGNMGGALLVPLAKHHPVCAYNRSREKLEAICARTGAETMDSAAAVVTASELVILAVKPKDMPALVQTIAPYVQDRIIVTVAVSLPLASYETVLGSDAKLVRMMPNTPALVAEGALPLCFGAALSQREKDAVTEVFSVCGLVQPMEEKLLDSVTALTGSSPAYVYVFIEAMADAAVRDGIKRDLAYRLAAQAVCGAAKMVLETGLHPGVLKDQVCSPGGTTIRAIAELEKHGLRNAVMEAMRACTEAANGK